MKARAELAADILVFRANARRLFVLIVQLSPSSIAGHPAWGIVVASDDTVFFTDVHTNSMSHEILTGAARVSRATCIRIRCGSMPRRVRLSGEHVRWNDHDRRFVQFWWTLDRGGCSK